MGALCECETGRQPQACESYLCGPRVVIGWHLIPYIVQYFPCLPLGRTWPSTAKGNVSPPFQSLGRWLVIWGLSSNATNTHSFVGSSQHDSAAWTTLSSLLPAVHAKCKGPGRGRLYLGSTSSARLNKGAFDSLVPRYQTCANFMIVTALVQWILFWHRSLFPRLVLLPWNNNNTPRLNLKVCLSTRIVVFHRGSSQKGTLDSFPLCVSAPEWFSTEPHLYFYIYS